jgi:hypothetical protein
MKNTNENYGMAATLRATLSVAGLLPKLAAMVAGVGILALFVGWRQTSAYFSELGASWIIPMVSSTELVKSSLSFFAFVTTISLISILMLLQGAATRRGLTWWSVIVYVVGAAFFSTNLLPGSWVSPRTANACASVAGLLIATSAALTIGELIAHLAEKSAGWDKHSIYLGHFALVVGFLWAPQMVGEAHAKLDGDFALSALPMVALKDDASGRSWRLLRSLDGSFLVVSLAAKKKDFVFRVVGADEITEIRSSGTS